jgi:uncharacterized membrane protein
MAKKKIGTREIVIVGLLTALNFVAFFIKIPYGNGAMVHMGTAVLFGISIAFGGFYGGIAGGLAPFLYDLMMGYTFYAPWSLVIKGVAGLVVGLLSRKKDGSKAPLWKIIIACIIGAAITLGGYFLSWVVMIGSVEAAILNIPSSLISSGVGMAVGIPLGYLLDRLVTKNNLLKKQ